MELLRQCLGPTDDAEGFGEVFVERGEERGVVFGAYAVDELEECGGDHLVRKRVALFAAGEEHWDKPVLGGTC